MLSFFGILFSKNLSFFWKCSVFLRNAQFFSSLSFFEMFKKKAWVNLSLGGIYNSQQQICHCWAKFMYIILEKMKLYAFALMVSVTFADPGTLPIIEGDWCEFDGLQPHPSDHHIIMVCKENNMLKFRYCPRDMKFYFEAQKCLPYPDKDPRNGDWCNFTGLRPHPSDCTLYLQCGSILYIKTCGPGTAFSPDHQICDHKDNVQALWKIFH